MTEQKNESVSQSDPLVNRAAGNYERTADDNQETTSKIINAMSETQLKWEHDIFRDALSTVNNTLRFQIQMAVPLLAACVTVLNIVPPQAHQELLNELDRWVFIPAILSMVVSYHGMEKHWYLDKHLTKLGDDVKELYNLVRYKYRMVHASITLQGLGLFLLMLFVLLEYK